MREPAIAWWPGTIQPGQTSRDLACTLDLLPTAADLAGATVPRDRVIDGVSLVPLLTGAGPSTRKSFFYYRGTQLYAVRKGPYKAHFITKSAYGRDPAVTHNPPALYQLAHDPSEQYDVAKDHPKVVEDLLREVEQHKATLVPATSQLD